LASRKRGGAAQEENRFYPTDRESQDYRESHLLYNERKGGLSYHSVQHEREGKKSLVKRGKGKTLQAERRQRGTGRILPDVM